METEYQILYNNNDASLSEDVMEAIKNGWKPLGGISISWFVDGNTSGLYFAQALVR